MPTPSDISFCAPAAGDPEALTELNATGQYLRALPASIGRYHRLRTLRLGYNQLEDLPAALADLGEEP